jgi:hypothetical protein
LTDDLPEKDQFGLKSFGSIRPEDARLDAIYLEPERTSAGQSDAVAGGQIGSESCEILMIAKTEKKVRF